MSGCSAEMPRYKCHKEVWALKIAAIFRAQEPVFEGPVCKGAVALGTACGHCERCKYREDSQHPDFVIVPEDQRYARFCVESAYVEKHKPVAGGYYVVYGDGYKSFSPAAAFEEGYSKI